MIHSQLPSVDYAALAPVLVAAAAAVLGLVVDLAVPLRRRSGVVFAVATAGAAGTLAASLALVGQRRATICTAPATLTGSVRVGRSCSYAVDGFTLFFLVLLPAAALGALLLSAAYARAAGLPAGEYGFLLLSSLTGALTMAGARDLITLLVGLETLTLPTYALVGLRRRAGPDRRVGQFGPEAAVKYLLVSIAASAVTLLGIAFVYGLSGTVYLDRIAAVFAARPDLRTVPLGAAAVAFVLAGFAFKIAAVPFHWWAPDVYSGAPVPVAAYLATVSKAGGIAGLLLVTTVAFPAYRPIWGWVLAALAVLSMTLANLVALRQRQAVRLLAWSSVAHSGYLLVPLGALATGRGTSGTAIQATLGYLALYVALNLGAFGCVIALARHRPALALADFRGLAARSPALAAALAFFLLGLAGLPPALAGLVAKVLVVRAALLGGAGWLAVAVAVNTVIGLAYYLRLAALPFLPAILPAGGVVAVAGTAGGPDVAGGAGAAGVAGPAGAGGPIDGAGPIDVADPIVIAEPGGVVGASGVAGPVTVVAAPGRARAARPAGSALAPSLAAAIGLALIVALVLGVIPQLVLGAVPGSP